MIRWLSVRRLLLAVLLVAIALNMAGCTVLDQAWAILVTAAATSESPIAAEALAPTNTPAPGVTVKATARLREATATPASKPARPTAPPAPEASGIATPLPGDRLPTISVARLPKQAQDTLRLIARGGPFPYRQDGGVFENREGRLPRKATGYYREYTVETPGSPDRGARRLIRGNQGEVYYTDDHYSSFRRVTP
jgi:ribonuclease T1